MMQSEKKRCLRSEIALKTKKDGDEAWLDNQDALNAAADKISKDDLPTPKNIKVMESLHRPVDCTRLFDSLRGKESVHSVSLVGVDMNANAVNSLSATLCHPDTKIRVLQVWRFVPSFLPAFCEAIRNNTELRDLRLTFQREQLDEEQTTMLLKALEDNKGLVSIKLFGVDLSRHVDHLASLVQNRPVTNELHLTRCRLTSLSSGLATAIANSTTLQKLDLSMNELSSDEEAATMLQSKSLTSLILSKNYFGNDATKFGKVLADNQALQELFLDSNPLSVNFATKLLKALEVNTTLKRVGFLKSYRGVTIPAEVDKGIRSLVALNEAGRGWLRAASAPEAPRSDLALLPHLLQRTNGQRSTLFGVLSQYSNLWIKEP